ncbi:hypothetical protein MVEG_07027 [Podila verticillata NRRL 6337]|nr:hypothetical protein MVEG_07027 [Podila verticillata NRRL 6337]
MLNKTSIRRNPDRKARHLDTITTSIAFPFNENQAFVYDPNRTYSVERIEEHQHDSHDEVWFLVKWEGYLKKDWVPERNMRCKRTIQSYFSVRNNSNNRRTKKFASHGKAAEAVALTDILVETEVVAAAEDVEEDETDTEMMDASGISEDHSDNGGDNHGPPTAPTVLFST